jgi:hypothetical protein
MTKTEMKTTTNKPLTWLVEDWSLYPRRQLDSSNVRDLADALKTGIELPPIVAEESTGRIIDGFHRVRAYLRVFGPDHEVEVVLKEYADEASGFSDAVRLNRSHGRKLNSSDLIRSFLRLREIGLDDDSIEQIVRIPKARVEQLSMRVAISPAGDPVPLKGGDGHLKGHTVNDEQIEALNRRLGVSYGRLARQLIDGAKEDLLPDDESFWLVLEELHQVVGMALAARKEADLEQLGPRQG